jgi:WD repeat-containing protein 20
VIGPTNSTNDSLSSNLPTSTTTTTTATPPSNLSCNGAVNGVNDIAFSPCGQYVAVVSQDGIMRIFLFDYPNSNQNGTSEQMRIQLRSSMKSYFGALLCVCWSPDGHYIATGGEDDLITLYSFIESRVVLRGRGHKSWVNCISFDPWTKLNSSNTFLSQSTTNQNEMKNANSENENDSDLENGYKNDSNLNVKKMEDLSLTQGFEETKKNRQLTNKKRTTSNLSDFNTINFSDNINKKASTSTGNTNNNKFKKNSDNKLYYRLASCGQDSQICFWDITGDLLKEKSGAHSKTRSTSKSNHHHLNNHFSPNISLPQIIIEPKDLTAQIIDAKSLKQQKQNNTNNYDSSSISTTSSIVTTAKNIFSLKNSKDQQTNDSTITATDEVYTNPSKLNSIFKKSKRNTNLNPSKLKNATTATTTALSTDSQVTLNSYKSSNKTITSTDESLMGSSSLTFDDSIVSKKNNEDTTSAFGSTFNHCPKLDEIPMIEPLTCKRVSNERLTSLVFKKDCLLLATQDGYVNLWARPLKVTYF